MHDDFIIEITNGITVIKEPLGVSFNNGKKSCIALYSNKENSWTLCTNDEHNKMMVIQGGIQGSEVRNTAFHYLGVKHPDAPNLTDTYRERILLVP